VQVLKDDDLDFICAWKGDTLNGGKAATGTYLMVMRVSGKKIEAKPIKIGVIR
jgi:hypothetical protein